VASFIEPGAVQAIVPEAASWSEKYGPIGFVAGLSLLTLYWAIRHYLGERAQTEARNERDRQVMQAMLDEQRRSVAELNAKLVDTIQKNHQEALELLEAQREDHEGRYQTLLAQHITASDRARAEVLELASSVTKAFQTMARKLNAEVREEGGPR
jgi:hypothetical protein